MDDVGLLNPSDQHFERHLVDDIQLLTRATLNEQNSPEILQYQEDLLNRLEQSLKLQVGLKQQPADSEQAGSVQAPAHFFIAVRAQPCRCFAVKTLNRT